jgi:hypothetical protein
MGRTKKYLTASDILFLTNQGRDIWEKEVGQFSDENICSPVRSGDKDPSFRIKKGNNGIYYGRDYGGEQWSGNAIDLIQKLYNLSFKDACNKIIFDFNLDRGEAVKAEKVIIEIPKVPEKPLLFEFDPMPYSKKHHQYWNRAELYEDFLVANDIFAVKKWAINKKVQPMTDGQITFAYYAKDINGVKILNIGPNVEKKDKWRTNIDKIDYTYLWYMYQYKGLKIKDLNVVKSVKDLMVFKILNFEGTATQSENAYVLEQSMSKILEVCDNPILVMGSDKQGVDTCKKVQSKYNTRYFNTPKNLLPLNINDPFGYACEFGLKSFDKLYRKKLNL